MARVKLSQVKVAGLLQLSQPAISRRLSGQIPFDVEELSRIADALGVPVLELFAA